MNNFTREALTMLLGNERWSSEIPKMVVHSTDGIRTKARITYWTLLFSYLQDESFTPQEQQAALPLKRYIETVYIPRHLEQGDNFRTTKEEIEMAEIELRKILNL